MAWYARYICELPSIRNSVGFGAMDVGGGRHPAGKRVSISFGLVGYATGHARTTGLAAAVLVLALAAASCRSMMPPQYEYDAVVDLSLDGSAVLYVNGSVPAVVALHGIDLDMRPNARVDRAAIRRYFTTDVTTLTRIGTSRRHGRRFLHLRLVVPDVSRLREAPAFAQMGASLVREGEAFVYRQSVGPPARPDVAWRGWTGDELVAVQLHLPSRIRYHNAPSREVQRGNILIWEQTLAERLKGTPIEIEARMDSQSILYTTLWLFGTMAALVGITFAVIIWLVVRRGRAQAEV